MLEDEVVKGIASTMNLLYVEQRLERRILALAKRVEALEEKARICAQKATATGLPCNKEAK